MSVCIMQRIKNANGTKMLIVIRSLCEQASDFKTFNYK